MAKIIGLFMKKSMKMSNTSIDAAEGRVNLKNKWIMDKPYEVHNSSIMRKKLQAGKGRLNQKNVGLQLLLNNLRKR